MQVDALCFFQIFLIGNLFVLSFCSQVIVDVVKAGASGGASRSASTLGIGFTDDGIANAFEFLQLFIEVFLFGVGVGFEPFLGFF